MRALWNTGWFNERIRFKTFILYNLFPIWYIGWNPRKKWVLNTHVTQFRYKYRMVYLIERFRKVCINYVDLRSRSKGFYIYLWKIKWFVVVDLPLIKPCWSSHTNWDSKGIIFFDIIDSKIFGIIESRLIGQ